MSTPAATPLLVVSSAAPAPRIDRATYERLARRVKALSWFSLGYMALEGGIANLAGILAGSVALIGFGIDSAIEGAASGVMVWRFASSRMFSQAAEHRAQNGLVFDRRSGSPLGYFARFARPRPAAGAR